MSHISDLTSRISAYALIVAGGSGTRMQSVVPKQFLLLNGRPLMMYTIEAFYNSTYQPQIIVVMHPNFHTYWQELCVEHNFAIPHVLADGGETRFHSVKAGLALVTEDGLVAVQDAVRPLTSVDIIDHAYHQAQELGNAVVAVKSRDSVRAVRNGRSESMLRDEIYLVQTPQTFRADILKKAYLQEFNDGFTDDASVVEKDGVMIHLTEGNYQNIKVTYPEDIAIGELLLGMRG
ncbi:2-C-methyl-D-erythritol 4-phosphate cytidylyltransferase [Mucilaginibacter myungsuensis]|uniref:2-C-methyl-D-erythritol 4-phosphate cytidylyltransferase n=1 Tax=Mucilaginibacter myungsuensis TaxID=649104 RepID=A0A929L4X2_9SPHI|nr:2-C-methyl-D-erythritol 4-phosphate cytidylyltransferase [Mucilaginibacter myungsuensis]MBE9664529.1 2-C-methyl-D-erythritol 4-phosphate cytidylyltransferase [Mucilaginibacter myungsuensis]MDN3601326.1 2-C-methyl-D-erythritol 4-phosphate cytidylyltransferase [Mucilaginibacter myungsuensis]